MTERDGGATRERGDLRWVLAWVFVLVDLQIVGRWTSSDLHDAIALVVLAALARATLRHHLERPFPTLTRLARRARGARAWLRTEFPLLGVDLRGEPRIPRAMPRLFLVPALTGTAAVALLLARPFPSDGAIEEALRTYAYAPYVVGLGLLWCALLFPALIGPFMPFTVLRDAFLEMRPMRGDSLRGVPQRASWALGATMLLLAVLLPSRIAVAIVLGAALVDLLLVWLPGQGRMIALWRRRGGDAPHRAVDWRALSSLEGALILVVLGGPIVVLDPWADATGAWASAPLTRALHWLASWGAAFVALVVVALRARHLLTCSLRPPSSPVRPRVHVESSSREVADAARARLRRDGWNAFPRRGRLRDDLVVRVEETALPASAEFVDLSGPLALRMLDDETLRWRLRRRSEIRSRRNVMHGLETILRHASRANRDVGTGLIVAPHQWFFVGVERDVATPDTSDDVGMTGSLHPAYRAVMTRRARHHLWTILDGVGVDLIHLEYGVGFRRLRVALRILFEVYDVHGGKRNVEERDFAGVHGVHVVVHEIELEEPRRSELYPESEYEQATRARILHLYRDRGGEEEPTEAPVVSDDLPLFV